MVQILLFNIRSIVITSTLTLKAQAVKDE